MFDPQQNEIKIEIKQIKREITLLQDNFKRSKKNEIYCEMDKSELQKCKPKKDKMDQRESQKCKIFHKSKKRQNPFQIAKMQNIFQNQIDKINLSDLKKDKIYQKKERAYWKMDLGKSQKCRIFDKMNQIKS